MTLPKPLMRYPGGKYAISSWIIDNLPPHKIYVEPFGGGASILLNKPRSFSEVYNDMDSEVVNLVQVMRDKFPDLERRLKLTLFSRDEFNLAYEAVEDGDPIERARRLLVRSWQGHSMSGITWKTGFRTNVIQPNRSSCAMDWLKFVNMADLIHERFMGVTIENRPAEKVIKGHDSPNTLFYVDPPYVRSTRTHKMYRHEMNDKDHRDLAAQLHDITGMVVLSGYSCDLYDHLFSDWKRSEREHYADRGGRRVETLWFSPNAWETLQQSMPESNMQLSLFASDN